MKFLVNNYVTLACIHTGSPGNIRLIAVDNNYLTLRRSEDSAIHDMHTCSSFFIYSNHCGKCLNVTTVTSTSCEILNKDTVSTFLIRNEVCEKLDESTESVEVLLSSKLFQKPCGNDSCYSYILIVPNPPNFKTFAQYYDGNLISIQTSFVYNVVSMHVHGIIILCNSAMPYMPVNIIYYLYRVRYLIHLMVSTLLLFPSLSFILTLYLV